MTPTEIAKLNGKFAAYPREPHGDFDGSGAPGLTKREHFTAIALQGLLANAHETKSAGFHAELVTALGSGGKLSVVDLIAVAAVAYADRTLRALEEVKP